MLPVMFSISFGMMEQVLLTNNIEAVGKQPVLTHNIIFMNFLWQNGYIETELPFKNSKRNVRLAVIFVHTESILCFASTLIETTKSSYIARTILHFETMDDSFIVFVIMKFYGPFFFSPAIHIQLFWF